MSLLPESQYRKIENEIFDHLEKTGDQAASKIKKSLGLKISDSKILTVLKEWRSKNGIESKRGKTTKKEKPELVEYDDGKDDAIFHNFSCSFEIDETIYTQFKLITRHKKETTRHILKKAMSEYVNKNKAVLNAILNRLNQ
jgi:hypothetical protein